MSKYIPRHKVQAESMRQMQRENLKNTNTILWPNLENGPYRVTVKQLQWIKEAEKMLQFSVADVAKVLKLKTIEGN